MPQPTSQQAMRKIVAIAFAAPAARALVGTALVEALDMMPLVIGPHELMQGDWREAFDRAHPDNVLEYVYDGKMFSPIETLAHVDELCVIAGESTGVHALALEEWQEDLLWLALGYDIPTRCLRTDGSLVADLLDALEGGTSAPARAAARLTKRQAFTHTLTELRLDNDFGSSGLWTIGGHLSMDSLDIPFLLLRRIAAWQDMYDEKADPYYTGDDSWMEPHAREELDIGIALQAVVGPELPIKVWRRAGWTPIEEAQWHAG